MVLGLLQLLSCLILKENILYGVSLGGGELTWCAQLATIRKMSCYLSHKEHRGSPPRDCTTWKICNSVEINRRQTVLSDIYCSYIVATAFRFVQPVCLFFVSGNFARCRLEEKFSCFAHPEIYPVQYCFRSFRSASFNFSPCMNEPHQQSIGIQGNTQANPSSG